MKTIIKYPNQFYQDYCNGMKPKELSIKYDCTRTLIYYYIDKVKKGEKLEETHVNFKPINWRCKCGYGDHSYFISCPSCGCENPLDGKGHLIK